MADRVNATREAWLTDAAHLLRPRLEEAAAAEMPAFRISVGFPSRGALSQNRRRIGECWSSVVSRDGATEMFISPLLHDAGEVGATVGHELIHCIDHNKSGHRGAFVRLMKKIGLTGKPTATVAGPEFTALWAPIEKKLGPYPHGGMVVDPNRKKQSTRMMKVICSECGYTARTTRVWLEMMGAPICPCNQEPMEVA